MRGLTPTQPPPPGFAWEYQPEEGFWLAVPVTAEAEGQLREAVVRALGRALGQAPAHSPATSEARR